MPKKQNSASYRLERSVTIRNGKEQVNLSYEPVNLPEIRTLSGEELVKQYAKEAKAADRRMRSIEAASYDPKFKGIKSYAYAKAQEDIEHRFGEVKPGQRARFDKKTIKNMSDSEIRDALADVRDFMQKPSSSPAALKQVYIQRVKTINAKYGTNFTWQEFADFTSDERFKSVMGGYGSDTFFTKVGQQMKEAKKVTNAMNKNRGKVTRTENESELTDAIFKSLKSDGVDITDLPKGWG